MLRSVKDLRGYKIRATDGRVGKVEDIYFDDHEWMTRYLVVNTGKWLPGRLVLISPAALGLPDGQKRELEVALTEKEIENSPPAHLQSRPVSSRQEADLREHSGRLEANTTPYPIPVSVAMPVAMGEKIDVEERTKTDVGAQKDVGGEKSDPNLRSVQEVTGYGVSAVDGEIGHVEDFIVEDESWSLRAFVVNTRNWWPGKKVLLAPYWLREVHWDTQTVTVDLTRGEVKNSPEFDPEKPVNREYEARLYDYYGRPRYWSDNERSAQSTRREGGGA